MLITRTILVLIYLPVMSTIILMHIAIGLFRCLRGIRWEIQMAHLDWLNTWRGPAAWRIRRRRSR